MHLLDGGRPAVLPIRATYTAADDLDAALERCEEALLAAAGGPVELVTLAIADHPLVSRVLPERRAALLDVLERRVLDPGEALVRSGDPSA